jgi:parallel beta-helix repeat protein
MSCRRVLFGTAVAAALCLPGSPVRAGDAPCDFYISAAPYTISAQGHYCLTNNLTFSATTGAAITIDAKSVVLDLKGYKIAGQAAGPATGANGVYVSKRSNVTVKDGLIRGFGVGVYFDSVSGGDNSNNVVENVHADSNTFAGISMVAPGTNNTVRNCVVSSTGGSTANNSAPIGIAIGTASSFVTDNTVSNTFLPAHLPATFRWGIVVTDGRIVNNRVIGDGGMTGDNVGLKMGAGVVYKDNIVSRCITSYVGGTPVGTTNYP